MVNDDWYTGKKFGMGYKIPGLDKKLREKRPHSTPEGRDVDVQKILKEKKKERAFKQKVKVVKDKTVKKGTGKLGPTGKHGYKFYAGGGKAIKGLGRAFQKGGKV